MRSFTVARTRLEKASFLTDDEKRAAAGYGPVAEAEAKRADIAGSAHPRRFMKFYPGQPRVPAGTSDGGQWTNARRQNMTNTARA